MSKSLSVAVRENRRVGALVARMTAWLGAAVMVVTVATVASPQKAWADAISTFTVTSTPGSSGIFSNDGYSFSSNSSITIDTTTGVVQSANIIIDDGSTQVASFTGKSTIVNNPAAYVWYDGGASFGLSDLPNLFIGFTGCANCAGIYFDFPTLITGSVSLTDPPPGTPEPGSALLLGSGLLGLAALALLRKRAA